MKGSWECSRLSLGSRWSWLQRRIADLNKQIYRLDHHIKETVTKEKLEFLAPNQSATLPQYFSITNGTVLESIRGNNGSDCLFAVGTKPGNNGFSHHHSSGHAPYLPHLLLPEALLGAKLQVKDLLSPSPLGRNLLYLEETNSTAARTRYVQTFYYLQLSMSASDCFLAGLWCEGLTERSYEEKLREEYGVLYQLIRHFIHSCQWLMVSCL